MAPSGSEKRMYQKPNRGEISYTSNQTTIDAPVLRRATRPLKLIILTLRAPRLRIFFDKTLRAYIYLLYRSAKQLEGVRGTSNVRKLVI